MRISLIVAMQSEYAALQHLFGGHTHGTIGPHTISLARCGVGKVNAALGTAATIATQAPDAIVNTGVAGGLSPQLQVMDIVAGSETCYHDVWCGPGNAPGQVQGLPERYPADAHLLAATTAIAAHQGLICCGDRFVTTPQEQQAILATFPQALAVDMESTAIAQTCYLHRVPFLSLRIISDTPGTAPDHAAQYQNFWQHMAEKSFAAIHTYLQHLS